MGMLIDDDLLHAARISEPELKLEIAVLLYRRERLTLGQAARLAGLSQARMRLTLAAQGIAPNYGVDDFAEDVKVVRGTT
jgi:predicted HTH domain antitoxin